MSEPAGTDKGAPGKPRGGGPEFDLDRALASVVAVRSNIPDDAHTAATLGTERSGNGVLIRDDGLVLTIGYLISEADAVWVTTGLGRASAAHVVAYDQGTGFGLVQSLEPLDIPALAFGESAAVSEGDTVVVGGFGGRKNAINARVIAKKEFAGYWEYVLDEAIFTAPAYPNWGGSALISGEGRLIGIGSLFIQQTKAGETGSGGNMFVPIDLLKPILEDLVKYGQVVKPPRPWLGMFTTEVDDKLYVAGIHRNGPADRAGLKVGDLIVAISGRPITALATFYRSIWKLGEAGVEVPLAIFRDGKLLEIRVHSAARAGFLKRPKLH